jgi:rhodanese-related sulfurtransferase
LKDIVMTSFTEISSAQLTRLIGTPDCPALIDIRIDEDFAENPRLIPTAKRFSHKNSAEIAAFIQGKKAIIICHKGAKLSQGVAALLRLEGIEAEGLEGGMVGWQGVTVSPDYANTLWVTRSRPKVDRIACPWLIRRFIKPSAQFLFVNAQDVLGVAEKFNATPFDVENVFFTHRGAGCTFDTMLTEFGLASKPLEHLAKIVQAADTDNLAAIPQAAGFLAISLGLSRLYKDDLAQLEAGMVVYDALYRWCRDAVDEKHDWVRS